jgi:hypothetical protein
MSPWFILLVIGTIIAMAYGRYMYRPSWEYLRNRESNKKLWVEIYSSDNLSVVEDALNDIQYAFLLRKEDIFRLRPDDLLLDIYKAVYPLQGADALEFETLTLFLKKKGIPEKMLVELTSKTVGDIVNIYLALRSNGTAQK